MCWNIALSLGIFALEACYFTLVILILFVICKLFLCKVWCDEAHKGERTASPFHNEAVERCSVIHVPAETANDAVFLRNGECATAAPRRQRQRVEGRRATPGPIPPPIPTQFLTDINFSFGKNKDYDSSMQYDNAPCTSRN